METVVVRWLLMVAIALLGGYSCTSDVVTVCDGAFRADVWFHSPLL